MAESASSELPETPLTVLTESSADSQKHTENEDAVLKEKENSESSVFQDSGSVTDKDKTDQEKSMENLIKKHLEACHTVVKPSDTTLEYLINLSKKFPIKFPIHSIRCEHLRREGDLGKIVLEKNINSAYPVLHESVIPLYIQFLEYKKLYGSDIEKQLYSEMNLINLVQRLLEKRAVVFCGRGDSWLLLDGASGIAGWSKIGTQSELSSRLKLTNCLSYDEIKLSALLSVSSYSTFINDGNRNNSGIPISIVRHDIERNGVVIGLIGPRLEKPGVMEWQEIVISKEQNTVENGYGCRTVEKSAELNKWRKIWSDFYDLKPCLPLYEEITKDEKYVTLPGGIIFNNEAYTKRLFISFDTLLLEAEHRANLSGSKAYIHVVGIGLGVWMVSDHQESVFLDAFALSLRKLLSHLPNVSDINFSWFNGNSCGGVKNSEMFTAPETDNKIRILFSKRNPHAQLTCKDSGKLLIVTYAWDGNALPGNEFWQGQLSASGDPAQASSSQIAELHNPHINTNKVNGDNLHIATVKWGVLHIAEYAKKKLNNAV